MKLRATQVVAWRFRSRAAHGLDVASPDRIVQDSRRRNDARGITEHA
ncbi:hypothetical protein [Burkholderia sp. GS2Y]|uniref:Uncharacterized protein n=1 Tax=Burkholderia theae TaxID=3143496 RepID=A0ABU9W8R0_9BURK